MKLVVGLGNPGKKYEQTRHNIGFEVVDKLTERLTLPPPRSKFGGALYEGQIGDEKTLLLKPHTYMNLSGSCVQQAFDFFKLNLEDLLVVCDDFHLPMGSLRMRALGSDGGQKGLADIIRRLGSDEFARLRMGIGPVPPEWDPVDFVLGRFTGQELEVVKESVALACDAVQVWAVEGVAPAMNQYNRTRSTEN